MTYEEASEKLQRWYRQKIMDIPPHVREAIELAVTALHEQSLYGNAKAYQLLVPVDDQHVLVIGDEASCKRVLRIVDSTAETFERLDAAKDAHILKSVGIKDIVAGA